MDLIKKKFKDCDINDIFFDTLKQDYIEFVDWYKKVGERDAFVIEDEEGLHAILILKDNENDEIILTDKILPNKPRIKICTLKKDDKYSGQNIGQDLINIALNHFYGRNENEIYVTVFDRWSSLIKMLEKNGFKKVGQKPNGEYVLLKEKT